MASDVLLSQDTILESHPIYIYISKDSRGAHYYVPICPPGNPAPNLAQDEEKQATGRAPLPGDARAASRGGEEGCGMLSISYPRHPAVAWS